MATHPFDFDRYIVPNYGLRLVKNTLYGKFSKNDLVFTGLSEIKNYLLTTYGNQIGEYFDFLSVVHTDNSETAMKPHVRWVGYVCKDTGGSSLIFVAHDRYGEDIKLAYSFYDQAWTLQSLSRNIAPKNLTVDYSTSAFTTHAVVGMKLGCSLLIYGNFAKPSAATKGIVAVVKSCYPITDGTMAMPVQCDDGSVRWLSFETSGDDLIIKTIQDLTAGKYVRFYGVIPCNRL